MICHNKQFVFIHIPKNGGKSIRRALRPAAFTRWQRLVHYVDTRLFKADPLGMEQGGAHGTALERRAALGPEVFDRYFTFGFVRNPWDRILSIYHFTKLRPKAEAYEIAMNNDLDGFVDYLGRKGQRDQLDWLADEDGRIIVDFVGRFERIEEDFARVCDRLGVQAALPHKNRTDHPPYTEAYSAEARDRVAELCRRDIEAFGYTFGG